MIRQAAYRQPRVLFGRFQLAKRRLRVREPDERRECIEIAIAEGSGTPRGATELVQEGIIVPPVRIARGEVFDPDILALMLANVRTPDERMGDLKAQRAACAAGRDGWVALLQREGVEHMKAAGAALLDYTERRARSRIAQL